MPDIVYLAPIGSVATSEDVRAWETYEDAQSAVIDWFEFHNLKWKNGDEDKYIIPIVNGNRYPVCGKVPAEAYH